MAKLSCRVCGGIFERRDLFDKVDIENLLASARDCGWATDKDGFWHCPKHKDGKMELTKVKKVTGYFVGQEENYKKYKENALNAAMRKDIIDIADKNRSDEDYWLPGWVADLVLENKELFLEILNKKVEE